MRRFSKRSLNRAEANALIKAMRAEGVAPPKVGWCVKVFGGEVCRHPKSKYIQGDTGYQVIEINLDLI